MKTLQIIKYILLLFLLWTPRILCILLAIFAGLFSFDVFGQGTSFWKTLIAFIIQFTPTLIIIAIIILSWKWPWVGGICFIVMGIAYLILFAQRSQSHFIDLSLFLTGILFLLSWILRKNIIDAKEAYWGDNQ
jgi:glucose-6-phosphate-specific signal transduction histidine kinase